MFNFSKCVSKLYFTVDHKYNAFTPRKGRTPIKIGEGVVEGDRKKMIMGLEEERRKGKREVKTRTGGLRKGIFIV